MAYSTMLLDTQTWDLIVNANGNIAVATEPYSLAQDAASAIETWLGECYWNTTVGVPWTQIFGQPFSLALLKAQLVAAALTVPDVASAQVFFSSFTDRVVSGQVQVVPVTSTTTTAPSVATFTVINPQGVG